MRNAELARQLQRLGDLFDKSKRVSGGDDEILSHWAKYLCVLCAGFLENAIEELLIRYVEQISEKEIVTFFSRCLDQFQNPNTDRIIEILGRFKDSWAIELSDYIKEDNRKGAINSIMRNRHQISHGEDSNITIKRLHDWFVKSIEVTEFIENQLS